MRRLNISFIVLSYFYVYSLYADSWNFKSSMLTARGALGSAVINNKIYIIGGHDHYQFYSLNEVYDPVNDSWYSRAPMNFSRAALGVCTLYTKIYAIGGWDQNGEVLSYVEEYDPITDNWIIKTSMPEGRFRTVAVSLNNKIYVIGGYDTNGNVPSYILEYDPSNDVWNIKGNLNYPRINPGAVSFNGKIYVIGGRDASGNFLNVNEEFDPVNNRSVIKTSMPTRRAGVVCAVLNNKIYVIGGHDAYYPLNVNEQYDPLTDSWVTKTPMNVSRWDPGIGMVNGKIYVIGGITATSAFSVNEEYTPDVVGNYGIILEPDTSGTTYENVSVSYKMRVRNTGDIADTVILNSYSSANGVASLIYDSSGTNLINKIYVDSGETKYILLQIIPPPTVSQTLVDTTILKGRFKTNPSVKDTAIVITYILKQGAQHGIVVEPDTSGITQTSMPIIYNMRVYNYGFVDDTVLLSVTWKRSDVICIILDSLGINPINSLFVRSLQLKRFKLKVIPPNMLTVPFIYDTASVKGVVKADTGVEDIAFVYTQIYDPRFTYDIVIKPDTSLNTTDRNIVIPMKLILKGSPFDSINLGLLYNGDSMQCFLVDTSGNYLSDLKVNDTFNFNLNINIDKNGNLRDTIKVMGVSYLYPNSGDTAFVEVIRSPEVREYSFDVHNYESPFELRNGTNFVITVPEDGFLTIRIYDRLGREVKTLISHRLFNGGKHLVFWDGRDNYGKVVSPGTYIYVAEFKSLKGIKERIVKKTAVMP